MVASRVRILNNAMTTVTKKAAAKAAATVAPNTPRFYPADDVKVPKKSRKNNKSVTTVRASITPGTIVILLSGRFRGKRCVVLKASESGLLIVSGPFKINGIPIKRVNQSYVIATSTKVDLTGVTIPANLNDAYFAKVASASVSAEESFYTTGQKSAAVVSEQRKKDQATVDAGLLKSIAKVTSLKGYLNAKFSLNNGDAPHAMVF